MILLKLGGSVITDKSVPLSFRGGAVAALSGIVAGIIRGGEPVVAVHGGGSYGHHYSVVHGMHTKPAGYDLGGLAAVKNSMVLLNGLVLGAMLEAGLRPYSCPPSVFVHGADARPDRGGDGDPPSDDAGVLRARVREMSQVAESGMCPVTFGDAMWCGPSESYILSGDAIMVMLSAALGPRLAVFATDVDGLCTGPDSGEVIPVVDGDRAAQISGSPGREDVTGGMARKVAAARRIAAGGVDAFFVNGNEPRRIADAARGSFEGTLFPGAP